ncbi:MAG: hypothetical protein LC800_13030 [Acidobacteria bacterium]|nr:hypothetical protein [Acidobacteriota bacterium]
MTISKNRTLAFLAALETLQRNTAQMIEHMKLVAQFGEIPDEEYEQQREKLGCEAEAIESWDDALSDVAYERNRYVEDSELDELQSLTIAWKEIKQSMIVAAFIFAFVVFTVAVILDNRRPARDRIARPGGKAFTADDDDARVHRRN